MAWVHSTPAQTGDQLVNALRGYGDEATVSVRFSTSTPRTRRSIAELLQAHAYAARCHVAVAETRGIAVRWVDGIVSGTPAQLLAFAQTAGPVLDRSRGRASLAA